jgi:uroporphyrin-3 C-methyltransferase
MTDRTDERFPAPDAGPDAGRDATLTESAAAPEGGLDAVLTESAAAPDAERDAAVTDSPATPQAPAGSRQAVAPPAAESASRGEETAAWKHPAIWIALIALVAAGGSWLENRYRLSSMQEELARRLAESDTAAKEGRGLARQNNDLIQNLQARMGAVEAKVAESRSQQLALEAMYQELVRYRDDTLLAEVEHALTLATQQLQLAGNVESALIGLQAMEARLAQADNDALIPLRSALQRDIERLKAIAPVYASGTALKLDAIISDVDRMALGFEAKPRPSSAPALPEPESGVWGALLRELWAELRQLVRIERLDRPDPALLAPENAFFLRENIKLRLVNARLALLQRDAKVFREDLRQAHAWLERYFDVRSQSVQHAMATLSELSAAEAQQEPPTLIDTLSALRGMKASRDRRADEPR